MVTKVAHMIIWLAYYLLAIAVLLIIAVLGYAGLSVLWNVLTNLSWPLF